VKDMKAPTGQDIELTSLERTLIDITVRPAYSGGVPGIQTYEEMPEELAHDALLRGHGMALRVLKHVNSYFGLASTQKSNRDTQRSRTFRAALWLIRLQNRDLQSGV